MEATYDVCALGCVCWDLVGTVEHYPELDEKAPIGRFVQHGGGRAGTAAAAVAALGGEVAVFGRIGDDTFGQYILDEFASTAVNTDGVETVSGAQSQFAFCVAHEATGKRTIFYKHGSMARLGADDVDLAALTDCRCLLIDSHHPHAALAAAQQARSQGVPVVLDAERIEPHLDALLAAVDYPVLPESLVAALGDDDEASGIEQIMHHRPAALVVTRGADGAELYSADEHLYQPAFAVPQMVDTTGAGDVFHGAFAYALALGHDLQECLKLASATAALSTTALGGRGHLPSMAETRALSEGMCGLCSS